MKILIVSDTHGSLETFREVLRREAPFEYLIHAGDVEEQEDLVEEEAGCPCTIVRGNNDFFTDLPDDAEIELGGIPIFVSHGHHYSVSFGNERFREETKKRGCRIGIYGHTHRPEIDDSDPRCEILNPGSLTYPRQEGRQPSYIVMEIDHGSAISEIRYLRQKRRRRRSFW